MRKKSEQNTSRPSAPQKEPQNSSKSQVDSKLRDYFEDFCKLEEEGKLVNERKAKIFADGKADGLDTKAMRNAFRQRVRELKNPQTSTLDKLTETYLTMIRPTNGDEDARASDPPATSSLAAEPAPETPVPAHAQTRALEAATDDDGAARGSEPPSVSPPAAEPLPMLTRARGSNR